MKKTFFLLFSTLILACTSLQAQWFNNGSTIYFNDNVGIGPVFNSTTEAPTETLDVDGTVRIRSLSLPAQQNNTLGRVLVADENGNLYWRDVPSLNDGVNDADADPGNEIQDLSFVNGIISLNADPTPTQIDLSNYDSNVNDDFDGNFTSLLDVPPGLSDGDDVNDADADPGNEYNTGFQVNGTNLEISDGGGVRSVALSDITAGYAPLDDPDFTGTVQIGANPRGAIDASEKLRITGSTSDYIISVQDGSGRVQHYWNASTEIGNNSNYLVSGEPAGKILFSPASSNFFNIYYAPSGTAGNPVSWESKFSVDTGGTVTATAFEGNGASITNLNTNNISGTLLVNQIPDLDASKVTSGTFNINRINTNFGSKDITTTGTVSQKLSIYSNQERTDMNDVSGELYFDQNYYPDYADITGGNGGGLSIKTEDGWGAIIATNNMEWIRPTFNGGIFKSQVDMQDNHLVNVRGFQLKDWDDNTGGADNKYRLLARDGAFQFYNGGVVVGSYGNGTWGDLQDGRLIVEDRIGIGTTAPGATLHVNGSVRLQGINQNLAHNKMLVIDDNGNLAHRPIIFPINQPCDCPYPYLEKGGNIPATLADARFKKNIEENIPGLEFITQLRPVSYETDQAKLNAFLRKDSSGNATVKTPGESQRRSVGFVAQEVEAVLQTKGYTTIGIENPQNEGDHYNIRYEEFVMPLVKAIQEQQHLIETLQKEIALLKSQNSGTDSGFSIDDQVENTQNFALYQNVPNPFNSTTTIEAVVPESVQQAKIVVYNLQGLELESYDLDKRGNVSLEITAGRFPSGMYLYALMADGQLIDTKKMVLTR